MPLALAAVDGVAALAALEALAPAAPTPRQSADISATRVATFVRLVNAGAHACADRLAEAVAADLAAEPAEGEMPSRARLDGLFTLGMLALHQRRFGQACAHFVRVGALAVKVAGAGDLGGWARFHEALAREQTDGGSGVDQPADRTAAG